MTPAFTAAPKMAFASAIPATQGVVARVSAPGMANVSTTSVSAARSQVMLIWENIVSFRDVQGSAPVLKTASVTRILRGAYAPKDGLEMIAVRLTVQENLSVLAMEAAAIPIQEGEI